MNIPYLIAHVEILFAGNIDELSFILSRALFNGVSFSGREEWIRDECPAVFIRDFLGFRVVLTEVVRNERFDVSVHPSSRLRRRMYHGGMRKVDLSSYIARIFDYLLQDENSVHVVTTST